MAKIKTILNPKSYIYLARRIIKNNRLKKNPNLNGVEFYPPGHYYSPLLDIGSLESGSSYFHYDGPECWEHINLQVDHQMAFFEDLLNRFPFPSFPYQKTNGYRYFKDNIYFIASDAFTLSGIIRKRTPSRIIEIGSGFSSAVMLDTIEEFKNKCQITFIEPYPERLYSLLLPNDKCKCEVFNNKVQDVPLGIFENLEQNDILFIDSSHVAKIGSDVSYIFERILPKLRKGVIIHIHDIFYPYSYPISWIREGRAWNESVFLRAFLSGNVSYQILAFNSFIGNKHPEIFKNPFPEFLNDTGGSIWLEKVS